VRLVGTSPRYGLSRCYFDKVPTVETGVLCLNPLRRGSEYLCPTEVSQKASLSRIGKVLVIYEADHNTREIRKLGRGALAFALMKVKAKPRKSTSSSWSLSRIPDSNIGGSIRKNFDARQWQNQFAMVFVTWTPFFFRGLGLTEA
jgi:hypothetical protein